MKKKTVRRALAMIGTVAILGTGYAGVNKITSQADLKYPISESTVHGYRIYQVIKVNGDYVVLKAVNSPYIIKYPADQFKGMKLIEGDGFKCQVREWEDGHREVEEVERIKLDRDYRNDKVKEIIEYK